MAIINLLNKAAPGAILPVTNVRSYSDLALLVQSKPLVIDDFAVKVPTTSFRVPVGHDMVKYCLGYAPLYPVRDEIVPYIMSYSHEVLMVERVSQDRGGGPYFTRSSKFTDIVISHSTSTYTSQEVSFRGSTLWPHELECSLYCEEVYASQSDEVYYGRNYMDWSSWPNNTHMFRYILSVGGTREKECIFPPLNFSCFGRFAISRGG